MHCCEPLDVGDFQRVLYDPEAQEVLLLDFPIMDRLEEWPGADQDGRRKVRSESSRFRTAQSKPACLDCVSKNGPRSVGMKRSMLAFR